MHFFLEAGARSITGVCALRVLACFSTAENAGILRLGSTLGQSRVGILYILS